MLSTLKNKILPLSLIISASLLSGCGGGSSEKNVAPVVSGDSSPVVAENTINVGNYSASDANGDAITLSITGNASNLFTIDQTGSLNFIQAPDYDNGDIGPFSVTIVATDDSKDNLAGQLAIQVSVGDEKDTPSFALVQTVAPDYSSSEVITIDAQTQQVNSGYYIKAASDYTLSTYKSDVYHIGRYFIDTITKYNADDLENELWSFSTQDNQDSITRNPQALISVDETKAYILRYGSSKVWIVNPQATTAEDFKIGVLDLSSYIPDNNSSDTPSPSAATIANGKLYIAMQRLSDAWTGNTAYVAVFDVTTDLEIETNANADDDVMGIPLSGINPNGISTANEQVYVTTRNVYSDFDLSLSRIEEINTTSYAVRTVISADQLNENVSAFFTSSVIVSADKGYLVASKALFEPSYHEVSNLIEFNPTTGAITAENVVDTGSENIKSIALDEANFLWLSISDPENSGIDVINTATNTLEFPRLTTELNPGTIVFIEK
ncbi:MAG: cadherin repeat domain-containing protein [Colwellia sp.]|nr:cadherin repeat domain-containing protein [Colwellia sp.]